MSPDKFGLISHDYGPDIFELSMFPLLVAPHEIEWPFTVIILHRVRGKFLKPLHIQNNHHLS